MYMKNCSVGRRAHRVCRKRIFLSQMIRRWAFREILLRQLATVALNDELPMSVEIKIHKTITRQKLMICEIASSSMLSKSKHVAQYCVIL